MKEKSRDLLSKVRAKKNKLLLAGAFIRNPLGHRMLGIGILRKLGNFARIYWKTKSTIRRKKSSNYLGQVRKQSILSYTGGGIQLEQRFQPLIGTASSHNMNIQSSKPLKKIILLIVSREQ